MLKSYKWMGWMDGISWIGSPNAPISRAPTVLKRHLRWMQRAVDSTLDYDGIGWSLMVYDGIAWYSMVFWYSIVFIGIQSVTPGTP